MRGRRWTRAAAVAAVAATSGVTAHAADDGVASGWWRRPPAAIVPLGPLPSDEGFLEVGGTPEGPTAMAAVRAPVPAGRTVGELVLTAVGGPTQSVGVVVACPSVQAWTPVAGGAWSDRPPTTGCEATKRAAAVSADGTTWTFDVRGLAVDGVLDVVLVADITVPASPAFVVRFQRPTSAALVTESQEPPDSGIDDSGGAPTGGDPSFAPPAPMEPLTTGELGILLPTPAAPVAVPAGEPHAALPAVAQPFGGEPHRDGAAPLGAVLFLAAGGAVAVLLANDVPVFTRRRNEAA